LFATVFAALFFIASPMAFSAPGDILYVQVDLANLRQGGSLQRPVVDLLAKGHKLVVVQRQGEWVEVVADRAKGVKGWIHTSILGQEFVGDISEAPKVERFDDFKDVLDDLNRETEDLTGTKPFLKVEDLGHGVVRLTASDAWLDDRIRMETLNSLWDEMEEKQFPFAIHIVDGRGNRHLSLIR